LQRMTFMLAVLDGRTHIALRIFQFMCWQGCPVATIHRQTLHSGTLGLHMC